MAIRHNLQIRRASQPVGTRYTWVYNVSKYHPDLRGFTPQQYLQGLLTDGSLRKNKTSTKMTRTRTLPRWLPSKIFEHNVIWRMAIASIYISLIYAVGAHTTKAQTMGAWSQSNGSLNIPVTTIGTGRMSLGSYSVNIMNHSDQSGLTPPSFSFSLPMLPKPTEPDQLLSRPKYYQPDLGPFESNR